MYTVQLLLQISDIVPLDLGYHKTMKNSMQDNLSYLLDN